MGKSIYKAYLEKALSNLDNTLADIEETVDKGRSEQLQKAVRYRTVKIKIMKTETLYNITEDYIELLNKIEIAEGEISEEVNQQLEINEQQLQTKSIAYLSVIKTKEALTMQIDEEIKRLQALKKHNGNIMKQLKDRLLNAVNLFGAFEVGFTKFSTRNSKAVIVEDVNGLPKEFKVIKVTEQADKKAIKQALETGVIIEGCTIQENKNLKIN